MLGTMKRRAWMVGLLSASAAGLVLLPVMGHEGHVHGPPAGATFDPNAPKRVSPETAMAIGLATAEIDFGTVEDVVRLMGTVRAQPGKLGVVASRYGGVVKELRLQPGDAVRRGDVVAVLESSAVARQMLELRRLEGEAAKLEFEMRHAESTQRLLAVEESAAARAAEFVEKEVARLTASGETVSANTVAQRQMEAQRLRAEAEAKAIAREQAAVMSEGLQKQVLAMQRSVEAASALVPGDSGAERFVQGADAVTLELTAALDGVVVTQEANIGQGVEAGAPILTIGDFSTIQVVGEAPESLVERLLGTAGATARIRSSSSGALVETGTVRFLTPVIDPTRRTAHLIVESNGGGGRLLAGQLVELAIVVNSGESVVVAPLSAIVREGAMAFVFVEEQGMYHKHDVALGARDDQFVEIRKGLVPGDVVVVNGAFSLAQLKGESGDDHDHDHDHDH